MSVAAEQNQPQRIDPEIYYNVRDAAALLGCSVDKLNAYRMEGKPPEFIKFGRAVRYKGSDLIECLESGRRANTGG